MKIVRTPEERFKSLPGFPWQPRYLDLDGQVRMHYVEDGPVDGAPVLMLHGEPTWSYLYRKMIPLFTAAGYRAIAPDLIGFGRSDKPTRISDYSYQRHMDWMLAFVEKLDLTNITLVCQDWGSLIGLRLAAENPQRFARITVGNGFLPAATQDFAVPPAFRMWRAFAVHSPWFPIGRLVASLSDRRLSKAEIAAYDAPFPSRLYKAGTRAFPALVPTDANDPAIPANRMAWKKLGQWEKPFLCVFGKRDPILGKADQVLIKHIPGARGQPHVRIAANHFLQEKGGTEWAQRTLDWMAQPQA